MKKSVLWSIVLCVFVMGVAVGSIFFLNVEPDKVFGLDVTLSGESLSLSWSKSEKAKTYVINRSDDGGEEKQISEVSGKTLSFVDKKVSPGVTYTYSVTPKRGRKTGPTSEKKQGCFASKIKSFDVKNSPHGVMLTFSKVGGVDSYTVYRKIDGEENWTTFPGVKSNSFLDPQSPFGRHVAYAVLPIFTKPILNKTEFSETKSLFAVDPKKKLIALTYDDGPYNEPTKSILKTLRENNSRATFFVVGNRCNTYKAELLQETMQGCEIGSHTFAHTPLPKLSKSKTDAEFNKSQSVIKGITGKNFTIVRAPGGAVGGNAKKNVDYPMFNWSIDTKDWKTRDAEKTFEAVKEHAKDGSIVLMHDLYEPTAEATKEIVPYLKSEGFELVTVSEMFDARGIKLSPGKVYNNASKK